MNPLIRGTGRFVAVTCVVWMLVLWHWRAAGQDLDDGDLVLYLGVLPITVFALVLAVPWAVRGALAKQQAETRTATTTTTTTTATGPAVAQGAAATDVVPMPWHLLGAWVNTAGGASARELLAALEAGVPRPGPDPSLRDDDGLPVMTARVIDVDIDAVESAVQRLAAGSSAAGANEGLSEPQPERALRALAILAPLVDQLAQSLLVWWRDRVDAAASMSKVSMVGGDDLKRVWVLASWPVDWSEPTCAIAEAWLAERLCEPLAADLPPARWSLRTQRLNGTGLLTAAERVLDGLRSQGRDDPVVVMACHSDLDTHGIRALDARQALFHATRRPKVAMAGEGAAVLVLSAVARSENAGIGRERVQLMSPVILRRAESIESTGRASSDDTVRCVQRGLATAGVPVAAVARLSSDSEQHTACATELFAVTLALMPELDVNDDIRLAGALTGRLEAVAPLVALACAAAQASESGRPALALSLADPHWRMAAVLTPESFVPVQAPASSSAV